MNNLNHCGYVRKSVVSAVAALAIAIAATAVASCRADVPRSYLAMSSIPASQAGASPIGLTKSSQPIGIDFVLRPRNEVQMHNVAVAVTSPSSPDYGRYLTPAAFKATFGPTDSQVALVKAFAVRHGLTIDYVAKNNTLVRVHGTVGQVDAALDISLKDFWDPKEGRTFHAPDSEPTVDSSIAPLLTAIVGLSNKAVLHPFSHIGTVPIETVPAVHAGAAPLKRFAGPEQLYFNGHHGLSPADTTKVYNLGGAQTAGYDGSGEVLGLFELGTIVQSNITTWESYYGIRDVPRTIIPIDGYNTSSTPGGASPEYVLDVDMLEIWAHGASGLRIYDNDDNITSYSDFSGELVDSFTEMANDSPLPDIISVSYGYSELDQSSGDLDSEYNALENLAMQGQGVFVAAGDAGAWTDQSFPKTDPNTSDPGGQPWIVSVGGTNLTDSKTETYVSETSWYDPSDHGRGKYGTGGGGGVSQVWSIPSWQGGAFSTSVNPQGSTTNRNVPDVSLYGDYDAGEFDIYITTGLGPNGVPGWNGFNGTSAASPLWAGFIAVANQERAANGQPYIGFADPAIYAAAEGGFYGSGFHDIKDGSTNGVYAAVAGYDNTTGWGSINGDNLLLPLANLFVNGSAGLIQLGTEQLPFGDVTQAATAAGISPTTEVYITPGNYSDRLTISKPMVLNDFGSGVVTIGILAN